MNTETLLMIITVLLAATTVCIGAGAAREFLIGHIEECARQNAERAKRLAVR